MRVRTKDECLRAMAEVLVDAKIRIVREMWDREHLEAQQATS